MQQFKADNRIYKIIGLPGTGKTTYFLNLIKDLLDSGVSILDICFVSFTNKAIDEMKSRLLKNYPQMDLELEYFATLHSLCNKFKTQGKLLTPEKIKKFNLERGYKTTFNPIYENDSSIGDVFLNLNSYSRLSLQPFSKFLEEQKRIDNNFEFNYNLYILWNKEYKEYKEKNHFLDFTDLLEKANFELPCKYFFIDEAQDISPLQWAVLEKISKNAEKIYIAGDPNQSIFNFAGINYKNFLELNNKNEKILPISYRCKENIFNYSLKLIDSDLKNKVKTNKTGGEIIKINHLMQVNFKKEKSYLLLFRNRYLSKPYIDYLKNNFYYYESFGTSSIKKEYKNLLNIFNKYKKGEELIEAQRKILKKYSTKTDSTLTWYDFFDKMNDFDKLYIREILEKGVDIEKDPKIIISTIHQQKGGEADEVIIFEDISAKTALNKNNEEEKRVFYVGLTRSLEDIYIYLNKTNNFFKLT